jgi:hypothetical protein
MMNCPVCQKNREIGQVGICEECLKGLDPTQREYVVEMAREGLPVTICSRCDEIGKVDRDGLCEDCHADVAATFRGAMCCRCDIDLTYDGFCPNDQCPFNVCYQDESDGDWKAPNKKERRYIETVVKKRLADQ